MKEIVEFNEFENQLQEFKEKYDDVVYDLTVPEQEIQARTDRLSIGKVISRLDGKHKELKAPLKERVDLIDGRRKGIKDQLLVVQEKIKSQIRAHEKKIEEHAEKLQGMVDYIVQLKMFVGDCASIGFSNPGSMEIRDRLKLAKEIIVGDTYEDRKADATLAQIETIKELKTLLSERIKFEDEQAELEKLRKEKEERERAEREEKIRKEAAEKATREAEQKAELAKQTEFRRLEQEKKESERKAKAEIDRVRREREEAEETARFAEERAREKLAQEQEAQAEKDRIEQKKLENEKADKSYRAIVDDRVIESFAKCFGIDRNMAVFITLVISEGKIEDVSINY